MLIRLKRCGMNKKNRTTNPPEKWRIFSSTNYANYYLQIISHRLKNHTDKLYEENFFVFIFKMKYIKKCQDLFFFVLLNSC